MAAWTLGVTVATLAVAANGFLLPPSAAFSEKGDTGSDASSWTLIDPRSEVLLVPCAGCRTTASEENNLYMNISVGSQPGTLELGGKVFYPPISFIGSQPSESPYVLEVPPEVSLADIRDDFSSYTEHEASVTGWGFAASSSETTADGDEILHMALNIHMINMQRVNVPSIDLQVLKRPDGDMLILMTKVNEMKKTIESSDSEECDGPFCEWRQFLEDKIHGIAASFPKLSKGCPGMKAMKGMDASQPPVDGHHGGHRRPHGAHHGHRHGHHKLQHFLHRFSKFFMAVAVPIFIGLTAGVATYTIGMLFGYAIALFWVKFGRGDNRGYISLEADEEDQAVPKDIEVEAEARESFESAPPVYEEKETTA